MTAAPSAIWGSLAGNSTSAKAPTVATVMRKSSSKSCPWPMLRNAFSTTS